jgi:hypothetical protein
MSFSLERILWGTLRVNHLRLPENIATCRFAGWVIFGWCRHWLHPVHSGATTWLRVKNTTSPLSVYRAFMSWRFLIVGEIARFRREATCLARASVLRAATRPRFCSANQAFLRSVNGTLGAISASILDGSSARTYQIVSEIAVFDNNPLLQAGFGDPPPPSLSVVAEGSEPREICLLSPKVSAQQRNVQTHPTSFSCPQNLSS